MHVEHGKNRSKDEGGPDLVKSGPVSTPKTVKFAEALSSDFAFVAIAGMVACGVPTGRLPIAGIKCDQYGRLSGLAGTGEPLAATWSNE
jgi:hypothetical protein